MANNKALWKVVAVNIETGKMEEVKFNKDSTDSYVQDILDGLVYVEPDEFDGELVSEKYWRCSKHLGDEWLIKYSKEYCAEYNDDPFSYDWNTAKLVPSDMDIADIKAPKVPAKLKKVKALKNKMKKMFDEMSELACDLGYWHLADALEWSCGRDADVIRDDFAILEKAIVNGKERK